VKLVQGRILDTWLPETEGFGVVVKEGSVCHLLTLTSPISVGSLVQVAVSGDGRAASATVLFDAEQASPGGDARRWQAATGVSRLDRLRQRHEIVKALRGWLDRREFVEVQTPLLVPGTAPELHLDSFEVGGDYLVTSTEYQIKRLIVGGLERVYTLGSNFRVDEVGRLHNPEFTMLEWARAYAPLERIQRDAEELVRAALATLHGDRSHVEREGRQLEVAGAPWPTCTVREALQRHLKVDAPENWSHEELVASARHLSIPEGFTEQPWTLMSWLIDEMQPKLGWDTPVFLTEWPAFMTPSAGLSARGAALADRAELFIAGVEVADGFSFAREPLAQRARFEEAQRQRLTHGKPQVRLDERYLQALGDGLPAGAGMALGVDRLVMLLTGSGSLRDVLAFAWDER
jgi:lysyl-tRNA synthetase class 2